MGRISYNCYIKLFDSLVWPVINYGAAIRGSRSYPCIDAVFNRACHFFMGVGQQAPVAAIQGDMGITPPLIRQYGEILRQYSRLQLMPKNRVNYKVYNYVKIKKIKKNKRSIRKRGWVGRVEKIWDDMGIREQLNLYSDRERQYFLKEEAMAKHIFKWENNLEREEAKWKW